MTTKRTADEQEINQAIKEKRQPKCVKSKDKSKKEGLRHRSPWLGRRQEKGADKTKKSQQKQEVSILATPNPQFLKKCGQPPCLLQRVIKLSQRYFKQSGGQFKLSPR